MKIAQVAHDFLPYYPGGVSIYTYNLARRLNESNEVFIFFRKTDTKLPEYQVESEIYYGLSLTSINNNFFNKPNFLIEYKNNEVDKAFRTFLDKTKPDIVHFQFLGAGLSTGMVSVAKEYQIPTVLTLHDYWFMCPRGQMMNYKWELCSKVIEKNCASCVFGVHAPLSALDERNIGLYFIDLLAFTDAAVIKTIDPTFVKKCEFTIDGVSKPALLEHPPTEVRYRIRLPRKSSLEFSLIMPPETWDKLEGEGVVFEVAVQNIQRQRERIFSRYINPKHNKADRKWHDYSVDLSDFGDKTVDLIFTTAPGPKENTNYCTAGWGDLGIAVGDVNKSNYGLLGTTRKRELIKEISSRSYGVITTIKKDPRTLVRALNRAYHSIRSNKAKLKQIQKRNREILETLQQVDLIISPTNFLREKYIDFGVPRERIIVSDYGMNTKFAKKPQRIPSGRLVFGYTGTLMATKGVHLLIDAFARVPDEAAELRIHGYPPNKFHSEYVDLLKKKSKEKRNIKMMGKYDPEDISRILHELDILVVPSIWYENSPLTIHEAFIAGVPVITSNIGGMAELVKHKHNGLLFRVGDFRDLYRKIMMFIENPGLISELSAKSPSIKSIEENAQELEKIYQDLISDVRVS